MISQASRRCPRGCRRTSRPCRGPTYCSRVGADRVGEPALLAHLAEQPRRGRAAEDRVEHAEREAALVRAGDPRTAEADVVLLGLLGLEREARRRLVRAVARDAVLRARRRGCSRRRASSTISLVLEVSGRGDDDVRRRVAGLVVRRRSRRPGSSRSPAASPEHPAPERVVAVDRLRRARRGPGPGARPRTSRSPRARPRARSRPRPRAATGRSSISASSSNASSVCSSRKPRVQVGGLLAGRGVGRRPHAVEQLRDLDRRVALGALEQQVLEEVRDARLRGGLVAGARPHPEAERDRAHRGHRLGDHPQARPEAR